VTGVYAKNRTVNPNGSIGHKRAVGRSGRVICEQTEGRGPLEIIKLYDDDDREETENGDSRPGSNIRGTGKGGKTSKAWGEINRK